MALTANDYFKPAETVGLGATNLMQVTKASATTWDAGAVIIGTSGLAVEAADGPTTGTILGVAVGAAVAGETTATIAPATPGAVFTGRIGAGDTGGDYTSLIGNRYTRFGISLEATTSNVWYINSSDTTDLAVMVLEFVDAIGTNLAKVKFTFIDSAFNAI